jgi:hypothetical protein
VAPPLIAERALAASIATVSGVWGKLRSCPDNVDLPSQHRCYPPRPSVAGGGCFCCSGRRSVVCAG